MDFSTNVAQVSETIRLRMHALHMTIRWQVLREKLLGKRWSQAELDAINARAKDQWTEIQELFD